jgi:hypothetical protein
VLPVLAQMTAWLPASTALLMAIVMPRSLNDPVGLSALDLEPHRARRPARQVLGRHERRRAPPAA